MFASAAGAQPIELPDRADLYDPSGDIGVWYTRPAGAVVRLVVPTRVELAHAEWLTGAGQAKMTEHLPEQSGLILVLDLSLMIDRTSVARALMLKRAPELAKRLRCTYLIPPPSMSRLQAISLQAAATLLRALGVRVELRSTLAQACEQAGLRHAPSGEMPS